MIAVIGSNLARATAKLHHSAILLFTFPPSLPPPLSISLPRFLQPDIFSFNTAIGSCAKSGDWRRSLDLLAGMKVEGLAPDISSYNGVISACSKAGQWRIGLELLAKACRYDSTVFVCFPFVYDNVLLM